MSAAPINDGGPAFPLHPSGGGVTVGELRGMSLRDQFAGLALQGLLAAGRDMQFDFGSMDQLAKVSFAAADAMLKARAAS